jgi:hypothetical protein
MPAATLIVLSRVSATTIVSREVGSVRDRWTRVFDSFLRIDESLLKPDAEKKNLSHDHGDDLCGPFHPSDSPERVFERDWDDLSIGEKLTLY